VKYGNSLDVSGNSLTSPLDTDAQTMAVAQMREEQLGFQTDSTGVNMPDRYGKILGKVYPNQRHTFGKITNAFLSGNAEQINATGRFNWGGPFNPMMTQGMNTSSSGNSFERAVQGNLAGQFAEFDANQSTFSTLPGVGAGGFDGNQSMMSFMSGPGNQSMMTTGSTFGTAAGSVPQPNHLWSTGFSSLGSPDILLQVLSQMIVLTGIQGVSRRFGGGNATIDMGIMKNNSVMLAGSGTTSRGSEKRAGSRPKGVEVTPYGTGSLDLPLGNTTNVNVNLKPLLLSETVRNSELRTQI
jgi:hypothetical protein